MSGFSGFSRRELMAGVGAGLIGAPGLAFAAPDYKKFAGTKLEANLIKGRAANCCRNTKRNSRP